MDSNTQTRTYLIWFYRCVGVVALILCWKENFHYMHLDFSDGLIAFVKDLWVTAASRSFTIDLAAMFVAAMVFVWTECRRLKMPGFWFYFFGGICLAISFTFPLFLAEREKRMMQVDSTG